MTERTGMDELEQILRPYLSDTKSLSLTTLQLYEVYDGCRKYLKKYEGLFELPSGNGNRREALADALVEIKVLVEDIMWHGAELRQEIDTAVDQIDPDEGIVDSS